MAGVLEDTVDVMRQLQKLSKELGPVRSALTALTKREKATPNAAAAAASLQKIATRIADVRAKYTPFLMRMSEVAGEEVQHTLVQTAFLAAPAAELSSSVDAFRRHASAKAAPTALRSGAGITLPPQRRDGGGFFSSDDSLYGTDDEDHTATAATHRPNSYSSRGRSKGPDTASLFSEVCPPSQPFLLQPEYYQYYHEQLRLRVDMVEYLLATDRAELARHVARSYGLPLAWFPSLAAADLVGWCAATGTAKSGLNASFSQVVTPTVTPVTGPHRPTPVPSSEPLDSVDAARGGRAESGAGAVRMSPVQLPVGSYAQLPQRSVNDSTHTPSTRPRHTGADDPSESRGAPRVSTQAYLDEMQDSPSNGHAARHDPLLASPVADRDSAAAGESTRPAGGQRTARGAMPELVARVVATALFLKDEYFDRMVLERMVTDARGPGTQHSPSCSPAVHGGEGRTTAPGEHWPSQQVVDRASPLPHRAGGNQQQTAASSGSSSAEASSTPSSVSAEEAQRYRRAVLERVRAVARSHTCTQSGSSQFDSAMMAVVEELLATELAKRSAESGQDHEAHDEGSPVCDSLRRRHYNHEPLTAEELLAAEEAWSSGVLFIKRPTRYYCVHGASVMDGSNEGGTYPLALPNGMVVSHNSTVNHLRACRRKHGRVTTGVVCPPSDAFFPLAALHRIFVA